jgi:molecular chaperone DnaJ
MKEDYYKILGIERSASPDEIKKAFRTMAKKHHPDKHDGDDSEFKKINEAYSVLSDPGKKSNYDNYGSPNGANSNFSYEYPFDDVFSDIFGRRNQQPKTKKGSDLRITLTVNLLDILNGVVKTVKLKRKVKCVSCDGVGGTDKRKCISCNGTGNIKRTRNMGFANFVETTTCLNCSGCGEIVVNKCTTCSGNGTSEKLETYNIDIPPGIFNGAVLSERGKGNYVRGGIYGDLVVQIVEESHPNIIRDGNNLYYNKEVSVLEAILGSKVEIDGIDKKLSFDIPPGTQPGYNIRLQGQGVPDLNWKRRGDMYVKVNVKIPKELSPEEITILEKWKNLISKEK